MPLPVDYEHNGMVAMKNTESVDLQLSAEKTQLLLQEVPKTYHTEINDILLSALARTLTDWAKTDKVTIGMEGHGRQEIAEGIDTNRTVGWFTTIYPLLLETGNIANEDELIKSIKEQMRCIPDKGIGYGVLKYINKDEELQGRQSWDLVFNYLGQLNNAVGGTKWLERAIESKSSGISADNAVSENLSVTSWMQGGELVMNWTYSNKHYRSETISKLASAFMQNLEKLIIHCIETQKSGKTIFTPSDYGLASDITYQELDRFLNEEEDNILSF